MAADDLARSDQATVQVRHHRFPSRSLCLGSRWVDDWVTTMSTKDFVVTAVDLTEPGYVAAGNWLGAYGELVHAENTP